MAFLRRQHRREPASYAIGTAPRVYMKLAGEGLDVDEPGPSVLRRAGATGFALLAAAAAGLLLVPDADAMFLLDGGVDDGGLDDTATATGTGANTATATATDPASLDATVASIPSEATAASIPSEATAASVLSEVTAASVPSEATAPSADTAPSAPSVDTADSEI